MYHIYVLFYVAYSVLLRPDSPEWQPHYSNVFYMKRVNYVDDITHDGRNVTRTLRW